MGSFWQGRNTFVTGGTGFVGANLVGGLVGLGARVVCLERDVVQSNSLDILGLRDRVTVVSGSIEDLPLIERILNEYEIDAVFHLAAQALVGAANASPLSTFEANIRGTYLVLEACRRSENVSRIVIASSDKAYGAHETLPYREDFPLNASFPYDVSKTCSDLLAQSFARTYDLPVSISRSANIYGPGDLNMSRIIPGTIVSVLRGENPIIRSDGTPIREFVYVDDVVNGYLRLAEEIDRTKGEAFNFGTNEPTNMLDLVNMIVAVSGKGTNIVPNILLNSKIEREIDAQYLSADKIFDTVGWKTETDLNAGLEKTFAWYQNNLEKIA